MLRGFLCVDEKNAVISKWQLNEFHLWVVTLKVKQAAICPEKDADAVHQVVLCFTEHHAEEDGEQLRLGLGRTPGCRRWR